MNRSLTSGILTVASGKFITLFLGIISSPLLYRWMGPADYGAYATVLSAHSIIMIFVSTAVADGVRKYVAEERSIDNWERSVVGFYLRLATLLVVIGSAILGLLTYAGVFEFVWGPEFTRYSYVMIGMVIASQYMMFARKSLMGFGLEKYSEPLKVLYNVSFVVVAVPLVYYGYGVVGALLGQVIAAGLAAVLGHVVLHFHQSLRSVFERDTGTLPKREMMSFNTLSIVLVFLLMSLYHVDVMMLQALANQDEVGHYKAALVFAEFLWFAPITLQTVFVHSTSELWSKGENERVSRLAAKTTRYTFLLTAIMAIGMAALAHDVVPVYWGAESEPAVDPLLLLLPGAVGFALARPMLAIGQGKGELRYPIIATGSAAGINVVLNTILIPLYGMYGAAIATSIGYGSMAIFHVWSAWQVGFDPVSDARYARVIATGIVSALPIFALANALSAPIAVPVIGLVPISTFVVPPVGLALFVAIAVAFGALDLTEIFRVLAQFPDPIGSKARPVCRRLQNRDGEETLSQYFKF
ncbi:polysaccharide biosynthesis protein [Halostagnicola larsenii XH-48]|uniref:Polysaccharide biosynthesis protein n=1 Tax=Halostagnicola larsenii XH-48 TaxID=797299 RepID=W0JR57_9EURY|nr:flippase [Halostagnicola larsenii]AHF99761.1 polysaccharide biosynthesis protein [Halostagnicola larsenii XH-48]